ncbi:MAG: hypothetical protein D3906_16580 [Candidatus Electrothrix sp. AUS1_2]|nr:hypothetical protein [Candidatus Electrothrix sp. AUS1_2]
MLKISLLNLPALQSEAICSSRFLGMENSSGCKLRIQVSIEVHNSSIFNLPADVTKSLKSNAASAASPARRVLGNNANE